MYKMRTGLQKSSVVIGDEHRPSKVNRNRKRCVLENGRKY